MTLAYLANKPESAVLVFLLVAVIVALVGAVMFLLERGFAMAALAVGVAALALAFIVS